MPFNLPWRRAGLRSLGKPFAPALPAMRKAILAGSHLQEAGRLDAVDAAQLQQAQACGTFARSSFARSMSGG